MGHVHPRLGIFAKTFPRPSLGETLDAVLAHPIRLVQFNLSCAGMATLPDRLDQADCGSIAGAFRDRGLTMAAVSGTFNPLDPDLDRREANMRRFEALASGCRAMGAPVVTLCTGTRDGENMWRHHPGNAEPEAWSEMAAMMRRIAAVAERHGVTAAFEPETGNVVDSAPKAARLIDEVASPRLKVVLDPANLFRPADLPRMPDVLDEAFSLLAPHIALLHAKDVLPDGSGTTAPGRGVLDYERMFALDREHGLTVPIILHGIPEGDVARSVDRVASAYAGGLQR